MSVILTRAEFEDIFGSYEPKLRESLWSYLRENYEQDVNKRKMITKFIDPNHCVLHKVNMDKVDRFVQEMRRLEHEAFPAIKVIHREGLYYVVDGNHRTMAHSIYGNHVLAEVIEYDDASEEELRLIGPRFGRK